MHPDFLHVQPTILDFLRGIYSNVWLLRQRLQLQESLQAMPAWKHSQYYF